MAGPSAHASLLQRILNNHGVDVMLNGKRLGALLSVPTESDCRFLEAPPAVPPLKIFQVTYRPGRPKKGTVRPGANGNESESGPTIPWAIKGQQRY